MEDQEKLVLVAQAIAAAMGHEERWRTYLTVARMHIAGYEACQKLDQQASRETNKKRTGTWRR